MKIITLAAKTKNLHTEVPAFLEYKNPERVVLTMQREEMEGLAPRTRNILHIVSKKEQSDLSTDLLSHPEQRGGERFQIRTPY
mmetsp:Transcript_19962/g.48886  ORF Transcript_19962/g.48886 Transcript_19962/m.48886 type:complete len:83 (-) Transcript_19962:700-948(-)